MLAVVALFYYLNVARWMFIVDDEDGERIAVPAPLLVAIAICALLVLGGGLVPRLFVDSAARAVAGF